LSAVDQAIVEAIIKQFSALRNRGFDAFESEEAVKQGIILPTLQALGWNVFNTDEVRPEYSTGKGRVDYALLLKSNPAVFIEAKRVGASLSDDHQEQLLSYAFHEGVKLALLTNGITWEFYLPLTSGVWSGRKVYSIDLEQQDIQEASLIITNLLAKDMVRTGEAERYAKELHRSRQRKEKIREAMPEAWKRLIEEPNELLIELIAEETEAVCGFKRSKHRGYIHTRDERAAGNVSICKAN
jgi:predicted type IV restriction endonuclease